MAKQKLTRSDLIEIVVSIREYIEYLTVTERPGWNHFLNKSLILILMKLRVKVASKMLTIMNGKGCTIKLTEIEVNALLHFRNELMLTGGNDNGVVRLLTMNTK